LKAEIIADYSCEVGEGPLWHAMEQRLYWADIPAGRLFRYDPLTHHHELFYEGPVVGGFTIQADGSLLLFMEHGAVSILRHGNLEPVIDSIPGEEYNRFNDVIADPTGRVFCGTMAISDNETGNKGGTLYLLDLDGTISTVVRGVGISNGMGFSPNHKTFYYTDTLNWGIDVFEYNEQTGVISNRREFTRSGESAGSPDGMTVDADGNVWSARWGGSGVFKYATNGEEIDKLYIPTGAVSSVTFGGSNYTDMYITTADGHDKIQYGSHAGALFRINVGVKGVPEFTSRIGIQ